MGWQRPKTTTCYQPLYSKHSNINTHTVVICDMHKHRLSAQRSDFATLLIIAAHAGTVSKNVRFDAKIHQLLTRGTISVQTPVSGWVGDFMTLIDWAAICISMSSISSSTSALVWRMCSKGQIFLITAPEVSAAVMLMKRTYVTITQPWWINNFLSDYEIIDGLLWLDVINMNYKSIIDNFLRHSDVTKLHDWQAKIISDWLVFVFSDTLPHCKWFL